MNLHNVWLVIQREYLERVRTKAFVIATILVPLFMAAVTIVPTKLASMKVSGTRKIVIVTDDAKFGATVASQLTSAERKTEATVDTNTSEAERDALRSKVSGGELDGFLWVTSKEITDRKATYTGREVGDMLEIVGLQKAATFAAIEQRMTARGMSGANLDELLKGISVDTIQMARGKERKVSGVGAFLAAFTMVFALYMTLILYGVAVLRSVIEEKSSRIVEVLIASIAPIDLMMGKILGVGAVGLTQTLIWAVGGFLVSSPALLAAKGIVGDVQVPTLSLVLFPFYFLLGFFLYSASFAAIGAAVNSEQEAQQFNFIGMSPLIVSMIVMMNIIRSPNAPWSVVFSIFPWTAPICMFLRISVETPPLWQIATSIGLMAVTAFVMIWLCARIYRVGILMYGKRPTLPEIIKWMRYA